MKKGILIIPVFLLSLLCISQQPGNASLKLWYNQPAVKWTEALPIGNGRLGAMVFGGVEQDRIQFNEETLWTGGPRDYHRTGAADHLETIRKLLNEGKQKEAEQLAEQKFMGMRSDEGSKADWVRKVTTRVSGAGDMASPGFDDSKWKTIEVPTYEGWETTGLEVDGAVWFRTTFELPFQWHGKNVVLDLNRIRDHDHSYINGKLAGTMEGGEPRKYLIKKELLQPGKNTIAILVLNYFDKGGIAGYKDTTRHIGLYPEGDESAKISLVKKWKYFILNDEPPAVPRYQADYQPFGDLWLDIKPSGEVSDYNRVLDLNNAIITTSYSINGVKYSRDYFSSAPAGLIVVRLTADKKGNINFKARLTSPHKNSITKRSNENTLRLSLAVRNGVLKGVSYLYADHKGGKLTITDDNISVAGADEVTLYLSAATNYVNYKNVSGNADLLAKQPVQSVNKKSFDLIKAAHIKEYTKLFNTFFIDLGATENERLPTNERIERFSKGSDPSLVSLFVQYGRYLLISSSRPGTMPANLQGIWNDLLAPPWGSKYTTNINAEMNYWPADVLNLLPMHKPLFE
ncbi:MAG TPA: glycoside hydrolase N-terminal domain-containing protein, partial [Chitinophagaceae bacterium]